MITKLDGLKADLTHIHKMLDEILEALEDFKQE